MQRSGRPDGRDVQHAVLHDVQGQPGRHGRGRPRHPVRQVVLVLTHIHSCRCDSAAHRVRRCWFSSSAVLCCATTCGHAPGAQPTDALRRDRFESSLLCGALRVVDIGGGPQGTRATRTMVATRGCSSLPRWLSSCTVHQASARFRLPFRKLHYCAFPFGNFTTAPSLSETSLRLSLRTLRLFCCGVYRRRAARNRAQSAHRTVRLATP